MTSADPSPSPSAYIARPVRLWVPFVVGIVLGVVLWSLLGPALVGWWSGPLLQGGLSCGPTVERAVLFFVKVEVGVALVVGLLTMLLVTFVRRKVKAH